MTNKIFCTCEQFPRITLKAVYFNTQKSAFTVHLRTRNRLLQMTGPCQLEETTLGKNTKLSPYNSFCCNFASFMRNVDTYYLPTRPMSSSLRDSL